MQVMKYFGVMLLGFALGLMVAYLFHSIEEPLDDIAFYSEVQSLISIVAGINGSLEEGATETAAMQIQFLQSRLKEWGDGTSRPEAWTQAFFELDKAHNNNPNPTPSSVGSGMD